ncbi:MAG: 1-(5-phosphoribosyl)-5-amino-4-imidazole-carboxylate carboxylase [Chloroflexi bacterium RBG_13_60_13]|nr:MAG: 1-(5-phosphoribosyl)-5-amino-4-imidazole-carboxylate carboxylase [Chloroflexi bacterium RBG_13_60_13]
MNPEQLRQLLTDVQSGRVGVEKALTQLKLLPYEDIGFAKLDHHRWLRKGFPEVVLCRGKTVGQVVGIVECLSATGSTVLATKASPEMFAAVHKAVPGARFCELPGLILVNERAMSRSPGFVLVVTAGTADIPAAEEAAVTAEAMGNRVERLYDVGVAGLHRLLDHNELLLEANVIVAVAGMEGALASVISGMVERPIIAVPTSVGYGANFEGLAALLAMLNSCAPGVAVVNIDNGFGAGYLASLVNRQTRKKR